MSTQEHGGVVCAARHALAWLVVGNSVGLLLSTLLLEPSWQPGEFTYGHWVPVHLNSQLYGWTALPLVAWLLSMYEVDLSRFRRWGAAVIAAWSAALAASCLFWLRGDTSGKIFLDWRNGSLWAFLTALIVLWILLCASFRDRAQSWRKIRRRLSLIGLIVLAAVPGVMVVAASPKTYPPIDPTTGGPTGSSLLGSTLSVIGLMLLLPRVTGLAGRGKAGLATWIFFVVSWLVFAVTESIGGGHFDFWQIGAMLMLLPWAWLIPRDWKGYAWPQKVRIWRNGMLFWWGMLVLTGVSMYAPGVLDCLKFTQGLVGHSHLAMAGFTTSFCAVLITLLTNRAVGGTRSIYAWHLAVAIMILALVAMGWREGQSPEWMIVHATWRQLGFVVRASCGLVMLAASVDWLIRFTKS
ncbi:hypothetical protein JIN85_11565 [Luteolibacter pohnpeiensis]|uniref:Uncharacterized protein n=1 Tax=Luteolibacter pohnpeiensis TaxID=454153 RepID=A0A934VUZ8_9BACT|nr:hypothetical protein [Luteolibacter pohnpeiensis]MBK1883057.1 hypothetical protein [Luteolibacter pohnpeiensis]